MRKKVFQPAQIATYTRKQYQIMEVLCAGSGTDEDGNVIPCDMKELLERLPYRTTRDSMHFSIRALENHGLVERKSVSINGTNRRKTTYLPTKLAMQVIGVRSQERGFLDVACAAVDVFDL